LRNTLYMYLYGKVMSKMAKTGQKLGFSQNN
jgi:hypothetical protein